MHHDILGKYNLKASKFNFYYLILLNGEINFYRGMFEMKFVIKYVLTSYL